MRSQIKPWIEESKYIFVSCNMTMEKHVRLRRLVEQARDVGFDKEQRRDLVEGAKAFKWLHPGDIGTFLRLLDGKSVKSEPLRILVNKLGMLSDRVEDKVAVFTPEDIVLFSKIIELVHKSFARHHFADVSREELGRLSFYVSQFAKVAERVSGLPDFSKEDKFLDSFAAESLAFGMKAIEGFDPEGTAFQLRQRQEELESSDVFEARLVRMAALYREREGGIKDALPLVEDRVRALGKTRNLLGGEETAPFLSKHPEIAQLQNFFTRIYGALRNNPTAALVLHLESPVKCWEAYVGQAFAQPGRSAADLAKHPRMKEVLVAAEVLMKKSKNLKAAGERASKLLNGREIFMDQKLRELTRQSKLLSEEMQLLQGAFSEEEAALWETWLENVQLQADCEEFKKDDASARAKGILNASAEAARRDLSSVRAQMYFYKSLLVSLHASTKRDARLHSPVYVPALRGFPKQPFVYDFASGKFSPESSTLSGASVQHFLPDQMVFFQAAAEYLQSTPLPNRAITLAAHL